MYIQITDRCNMSCGHCGFDCGPQGNDMSPETFEQAARLAQDCGENIFLGGGEPTLNPHFWAILGMSLAYSEETPGIITNGSMKEISLKLASLARKGIIYAGLSQDIYHDPIDGEVYQAFASKKRSGYDSVDAREIRDVSYKLIAAGRSADDEDADQHSCICCDILVDPLGNIYSCGCKTKSLGTVWAPSSDWGFYCQKEVDHQNEDMLMSA